MVQTRSQWRASASRLSPELLRMIFAWLCPHCCGNFEWQNWADGGGDDEQHEQGIRSLVSLCLVSVAFRNAAQEVLYHSFNARYHTKSSSRLRLESFLRSIAARPDLARSVKAVSLDQSSFENLDFFASRDAFDHCAHALGTSAFDIWKQAEHVYRAQAQHPGCEAFFVRDADPGSWAQHPAFPFLASELLTMLVALLPNLSYLKVESAIEQLDPSRATSNAIGLTRLTLKTLDTNLRFESLLKLSPDIETLVCRSRPRSRPRSRLSQDSLPSVRSLVVDSSSVDQLDIQHLLSACTGNLSNFSYRGANATAGEIARVLSTERLHASLQSIHIDCRLENFIDRNRVVPNFRPFLNLRTLFLTIFLMHPDADSDSQTLVSMLPASIESLTLVGNDVGLTFDYLQAEFIRCLRNKLVGLAEAKANASGFEHLSRVRCDAPQVCSRYVRSRFRRIGVDFMYQEIPRLVSFITEVGVHSGLPLPDSDDDDL
ncbi:unnamed protein product [Clonostachys rosea f. rosea IK726]|uniref:Uncharacterized protein n=1 Tax=Clonostachys rosea f. rosea IK726 TaxID=1349383 RepID=A0ACA9UBK0_BIOOC|nr:unnamed protein product [Clonostachys rosea f. rosea IK726]